ncbi:dihydrofolate reductase family protein [Streptomyces sp. ISL-43]|uniref:dihydrofolate reductase family protein n=1 Tax=Streptomyces sp. ISL-43 TaxID=2819183 RepID=UPI002035D6EA|nr:dihydrofolate reductase family protein [Streptomyces sp. ISL-43]
MVRRGWLPAPLPLPARSKTRAGWRVQAPWARTTIVDEPTAEVVAELKATEGGDILVLTSASVIKALLAADKIDRLALTILPVFLGGGPRLFADGLPAGQRALVSQAAGEHGTLALVYDRVR